MIPKSLRLFHLTKQTKGKPNKNEISNFWPVSILNTFSKFMKKLLKTN